MTSMTGAHYSLPGLIGIWPCYIAMKEEDEAKKTDFPDLPVSFIDPERGNTARSEE